MRFALIILYAPFLFIHVWGQCGDEMTPDKAGSLVKTINTRAVKTGEFALTINARVPGGSWAKVGSEAAVISIYVDGRYRLDMMLFAGSKTFEYKALLGQMEAGEHKVSIYANPKRSAINTKKPIISASRVATIEKRQTIDAIAIANSPLLYARSNIVDKFSDIPLASYYEILPEKENAIGIRYTTVFTNEDGGTQTTALLARWGRATDIEWVYEVWFRDGKLVSEKFQGANHVETAFKGNRAFGEHPVLNTVTDNNNFSDNGCSPLRISLIPARVDLTHRSRETVMDENPWTYRIMAEEAMREGRINPANLSANVIDDLRNYLYVEISTENNGAAVSVEVTTRDGKTSRSDQNDERLRVGRAGFQRIAVRVPSNSSISEIKLNCHSIGRNESGTCGNSQIAGFARLNPNFSPLMVRPSASNIRSLRHGESIKWTTTEK